MAKKKTIAPIGQMILDTPAFINLMREEDVDDDDKGQAARKQRQSKEDPIRGHTAMMARLSAIKPSPTEKEVIRYAWLAWRKEVHEDLRDRGCWFDQYWIEQLEKEFQ